MDIATVTSVIGMRLNVFCFEASMSFFAIAILVFEARCDEPRGRSDRETLCSLACQS